MHCSLLLLFSLLVLLCMSRPVHAQEVVLGKKPAELPPPCDACAPPELQPVDPLDPSLPRNNIPRPTAPTQPQPTRTPDAESTTKQTPTLTVRPTVAPIATTGRPNSPAQSTASPAATPPTPRSSLSESTMETRPTGVPAGQPAIENAAVRPAASYVALLAFALPVFAAVF
ncbi:hypothetical protein DFJ77DRAFT_466244 [Powellomyces hirtus]|nr:hypothetical protein DFJ77DRAFT_481512 [Powellomyces hirtus]KAI8913001.1 hypothetical protein DFJ77DRAFT_466244 [Powellomyces hirtus]